MIGSHPNSGNNPNDAIVACSFVSFLIYCINALANELPVPPPIANGMVKPLTGSGERPASCFCISYFALTSFMNLVRPSAQFLAAPPAP